MKLKLKNKKFFKELRKLYKDSAKSNTAVSPGVVGVDDIDFTLDDETGPESNPEPKPESTVRRPRRKIGKSSYRQTKYSKLEKSKKDALRCYKVLGLKTLPNSNKIKLIDTLNAKVYNTSMPNLTKNACAYETRREALSERLPSRLVGARSSERLCRVLVSFECWGETHRRLGGGNGCSHYEFLRFMKIEESLDSPAQHSLKSAPKPTPPQFYPNCDKSFGKSTGLKYTKRCTSSIGPNPTFRTATSTKDARLKVVFSKDMKK